MNYNRFNVDGSEYEFLSNQINDDKDTSFLEKMEKRKQDEVNKGMEKYIPIGSVVTVANSDILYMIIGFFFEKNGISYDYLACKYPEGLSKENNTVFFNHENIDKIYNIGYINNQEKYFKSHLEK